MQKPTRQPTAFAFTAILLAAAAPGAQQDEWTLLSPFKEPTLTAVHFLDSSFGVVVGEGGVIKRTSDGGKTWIQRPSNASQALSQVQFPTSMVGYALGAATWRTATTLFRTSDRGWTWTPYSLQGLPEFLAIHFPHPDTGFAVGSGAVVLKTGDGGQTWTVKSLGAARSLSGIHFMNTQVGFAVGAGGAILKTRDGGESWSSKVSSTQTDLMTAWFTTGDTGFATGTGGVILRSVDSGETWTSKYVGASITLRDLHFPDPQHGFAYGSGKVLYRTQDAGATWNRLTLNIPEDVLAVRFRTASIGYAVGRYMEIRETTDGGSTWTRLAGRGYGLTTADLRDIRFQDEKKGWAVGQNGLILTTEDGGQTWSRETSGSDEHLNAIELTGRDSGYIVGDNGHILTTTNGGSRWRLLDNTHVTEHLRDIDCLDYSYCVAVGERSTILKTEDAGKTWKVLSTDGPNPLHDVHLLDRKNGFIAGEFATYPRNRGLILRSVEVDGKEDWLSVGFAGDASNHGIFFTNPSTGYAVGEDGGFLKSIDGGTTWEQTRLTLGEIHMTIHFTDERTGYIAGRSIYRTTDAGQTWTKITGPDQGFLWLSMDFPTRGKGFIVGLKGHLMINTNSLPIAISPTPVPAAHGLHGRLAGGFFHYSLSRPGTVSARIFDLQGAWIGDLFSGERGTGSHKLPLPSGRKGPYLLEVQLPGSMRLSRLISPQP